MSSVDIGFDLGTTRILIYIPGKGIVLDEPSVVAYNLKTNEIMAFGEEASRMVGRTHDAISVVKPLKDGVVCDFNAAREIVTHFVKQVCKNMIVRPQIVMCIPSEVTNIEANAVVEAAMEAGARKVYLIEEPIAAAIGAGLDISKPSGRLVVDIGGGTTDISVISLSGVVVKNSVKIAGNYFDQAIIKYIRSHYKTVIGEKTAERIKMEAGSAEKLDEPISVTAKGRNLVTGLPCKIEINSDQICECLGEGIDQIIDAIHKVIERTPPELTGDLLANGILLTGGSCQLHGLVDLISRKMKTPAHVAEMPDQCVAVGTGLAFDMIDELQEGFSQTKLN